MTKELNCEFQKEIDNEKVCKAFIVNRYGDVICQEEDCQLCKLKIENELIKAQYNCYACGNCKGKEDYINLEKHHKGLRKQFDKKVQALQNIKAVVKNICDGCTSECDCDEDCNYFLITEQLTKAEEE